MTGRGATACCEGLEYTNAFATIDRGPRNDEWLKDSVQTLMGFPWDRIGWRHDNSRRIDVVPLPWYAYDLDEDEFDGKGHRADRKVFPVDESHVNHWNHDPWKLKSGGNGTELSDGSAFLLPYYMGLYHGFVEN